MRALEESLGKFEHQSLVFILYIVSFVQLIRLSCFACARKYSLSVYVLNGLELPSNSMTSEDKRLTIVKRNQHNLPRYKRDIIQDMLTPCS